HALGPVGRVDSRMRKSRPSGDGAPPSRSPEHRYGTSFNSIIVKIANRSCAMGYGGNKQGSTVTRRNFLKTTSAIAATGGLAPTLSAPFVSTALAATKTLKILQWSHFIPEYDKWIDGFAKDWGKQNGITVTVDHIPHLELAARAAAEVSAGAGHDTFAFSGSGGPNLHEKHVVNLSDLVGVVEREERKERKCGRQM